MKSVNLSVLPNYVVWFVGVDVEITEKKYDIIDFIANFAKSYQNNIKRMIMKSFFSLIICISFSLLVNGQIRRKLLNTEIGVSNKAEVEKILKDMQVSYKEEKDGLEATNVTFANVKWEKVFFCIFENRLAGVMFLNKQTKGVDIDFIKTALESKYEEYSLASMNGIYMYIDQKTAVMLVADKTRAILGYVDGAYIQKMMAFYMNEL